MGLNPEILAGAERVTAQVWDGLSAAARTDVKALDLLGIVGDSRYTAKLGELAGRGEQHSVSLAGTPMYEIYHPHGKPAEDAVVVLQGASFGAKTLLKPVNMAEETGFNKLADASGVSIIYGLPNVRPIPGGLFKGVGGMSWNVPGVRNMSDPTFTSYNDMDRMDWMLKDAVNRFNLNPDTLTMAGMSDGGRMMNRYVGDRLGSIKAGVSVSGTLLGDETKLAPDSFRPAMMIVHGVPGQGRLQKDLMVPFDGGIGAASGNFAWGGMFKPIENSKPSEQLAYWLRNPDAARTVTEKDGIQHTVIDNGGVPLEQYLLTGAKHAWHGSLGKGGLPIIGDRNFNFQTSETTMDFLLRNRANEGGIKIARSLSTAG